MRRLQISGLSTHRYLLLWRQHSICCTASHNTTFSNNPPERRTCNMARALLFTVLYLLSSVVFAQRSFAIYDEDDLDATLGSSCIRSLTASIEDCHPYIQEMARLQYRSSLNNITAIDQVYTADCSSSLATCFRSVSSDCAEQPVERSPACWRINVGWLQRDVRSGSKDQEILQW